PGVRRNEVGRLVPQEVELPRTEAPDRQVVVLVRIAPLRAAELGVEALVGAQQAEVEPKKHGPGAEIPILLELGPGALGWAVDVESPSELDISFQVESTELSLRRGDAHRTRDVQNHDEQPRSTPPLHVFPPSA